MSVSTLLMRFIGTDGFMNLTHGKVYRVTVYSLTGRIVVSWGYGGDKSCFYTSPRKLSDDWESVV